MQAHRVHISYLFRTASMSSSTACNEYALLSAGCPCADTDAPLRTTELVGACFRFASEGDVGAGERGGRVRVPLAAMVMGIVQFAVVSSALTRSGRSLIARLLHQHARPTISGRCALQLQ
jgi:hypothetical protein